MKYKLNQKVNTDMFKNYVIVLLTISTVMFTWLAIRNSYPLECTDLVRAESGNMICLTNLGDVQKDEVQEAIERIKQRSWNF